MNQKFLRHVSHPPSTQEVVDVLLYLHRRVILQPLLAHKLLPQPHEALDALGFEETVHILNFNCEYPESCLRLGLQPRKNRLNPLFATEGLEQLQHHEQTGIW
jgi:hypothetical protein